MHSILLIVTSCILSMNFPKCTLEYVGIAIFDQFNHPSLVFCLSIKIRIYIIF